jgi:hypothetical protein
MTRFTPSSLAHNRPVWVGQEETAASGTGWVLSVPARGSSGTSAGKARSGQILKISLMNFFNTLKSFNFDNSPTVGPSQSGHLA